MDIIFQNRYSLIFSNSVSFVNRNTHKMFFDFLHIPPAKVILVLMFGAKIKVLSAFLSKYKNYDDIFFFLQIIYLTILTRPVSNFSFKMNLNCTFFKKPSWAPTVYCSLLWATVHFLINLSISIEILCLCICEPFDAKILMAEFLFVYFHFYTPSPLQVQ